ncbi:hypothetical protein RN629_00275 [Sphingomonadaceae bacterium jetA1]|jgi:hypothetical protein|uniref:hypothetical protein n=1 Tax=Facivitalis istanbulensis TaxID=3075838 RepID=UPI00348EFFDA
MNGFFKKLGLGLALGATAMTVAAPAEAQRWGPGWGGGGWGGGGYYHRDRGGDAVAGALLGGIVGLGLGAAIASSNRPRYVQRDYYYDNGYTPYYAPPAPPPPPPPVVYEYRSYTPRCWNDWRWDPYWGRSVPVRVCN